MTAGQRHFLTRRQTLAGAAALTLAGPALASDGTARRAFRIMRDGSDIGRHELSARRAGGRFEIEIDLEIVVRVLGIAAYRYELGNREVWEDGRIVSVRSSVNDDGDREFSRIDRKGDGLEVDGSGYSGPAPLDAVTTSYYAQPFLERRPWLSTQSGKRLEIDTRKAGGGDWRVTGELDFLLSYDSRGEWVGNRFDAGGEEAHYEVIDETGRIGALWSA